MINDIRTTVFGAIGSAALITLDMIQHGTTDAKTLAIAFTLAALGYHAKDSI